MVAAGWTSGIVEMDRTIRFAAADWRDGDKLNRDKIAAAISGVLAKTLCGETGGGGMGRQYREAEIDLQAAEPDISRARPHRDDRGRSLVAPDKPGGSDRLMLWIGSPVISTTDESAGAKLNLTEESSGDEEGDQKDDNGSVDALAKEFKGQRWDADKSAWK